MSAIAVAGLALVGLGGRAAERPPYERLDEPSLVACGGCHRDVWKEWSESLHARAWTNANARTATRDFEIESCRPCHSPRPIFETGLDRAPAYRDFNQADGVHCLACHGLEGGVAAARAIEGAPCRPRGEPRLLEARACFPCHEPTHQAFQEYEQSDAFALGLRCADCHMPVVAERGGRSHGPHGGFDPDFVARALAWDATVEDGAVVLELRNRAGHCFPGEIPSRALLLTASFADGAGAPIGTAETVLLRKPHKGEERADDRLRPDETRRVVFRPPAGARSARVEILFRPLPLLPPESCFLLGERVLTLADAQ